MGSNVTSSDVPGSDVPVGAATDGEGSVGENSEPETQSQSLSPEIQALLEKQQECPLTTSQFENRIGESFTIVEGDVRVPLELTSVERIERQPGTPTEDPASLLFTADPNWDVPQRLYRLEHDELKEIALFLVPVQAPPDADQTGDNKRLYLETTFN